MRELSGWYYAVEKFDERPDLSAFAGESSSADSATTKQKILIVDDEKRIADTLCEILNASGFEARACYDGWAALEAAARFHPDYLLSDVLMPKMNGVELAIAIRNLQPTTKILLFSGQVGISKILAEGSKRGLAFELIAKPIHPLKLLEHIRKL